MPAFRIKFSIVVLSFLFFFCANEARSKNPIQVVSGHPRMLLTPSILTTLRARVTSVTNGGLGTHTATYTALKNWCDSVWGITGPAGEDALFGASDRYYDSGMLRYALIYALGEITGFSYTTHSINDYGDKARDIMLRHSSPPATLYLLEYTSYTYDWVSMASPKDGSYRMSDAQKQTVIGYFYYWAGATPQPPMYTGYFGLFVPNSFYPGLAFWGDGVGGAYGGYTADQLAQRYVDYIPTYLTLAIKMTQESGSGGGNRNGTCYTNYTGNGQFTIGSTLRSQYVMTTATNLTANETYNYYTSFLQTPIWFIYESQPGLGHWTQWDNPATQVPLVLWDDCGLLTPNLNAAGFSTVTFKLAAMLYGLIGNTDYQQLIYWFLAHNGRYVVGDEDATFDVIFNPRTVPTSLPSTVSPVKAFGWNSSLGTIDYFNSLKAGIGEVHYNSSLDFTTNPTKGIFRDSPQFYAGDHNHFDSLAFYIFKGESLALPNTGKYYGLYEGQGTYPVVGFPHNYLYYHRNVAYNSILIMDPDDVETVPFGGYTWTWRDGGQKMAPYVGDWGGLIKHEDSTNYTYTSADATIAYSNKADLVQRDFVYLKGTSSTVGDRDYFVVFDRITSKVATDKKVFLLHTIGEPSLDVSGTWTFGSSSGGLYTASNATSVTVPMSTAKLHVKSLLPTTNTTYKYGGTATTTLTQALDATDNGSPIDINVTSSANFSPNPTVTITSTSGKEAFSCTGKATGKLTGCTRGTYYWRYNGARTHAIGATVLQEFPWMFREVDTGKWVNYPHDFGGQDPAYGTTLDEFGKWGIRIENGTNELNTNFLTVLHPTMEMSRTMPTTTLITSSVGNAYGVLIADTTPRIVMFSQTTALVSDVTYTASYSQSLTGKHLITGLVPFAGYDIYKNGSKIDSKIASSQGIIYFESTGSSTFRLVQTSGPVPAPSDTTLPSTPTNLTAAAISTSQINLSWTASTDNVGVSGYRVYRNGTQIGTSATNSYQDTGLTLLTTYSYTVVAYDAAGNISGQSASASATTKSSGDTTPPVRSSGSPTGTLSAGTTGITLSLTTNENATCKYSTTAGTSYSSMANTFSTTGATSHSTAVSGLSNGTTYNYYIRCMDASGNADTNDYIILFSVVSPAPPPTPPPSGYVINDFTFYPPPNVSRPAKGVQYVDPDYHTTITRITNALTEANGVVDYAQPGYPKHSIENADGTRLLIQSNTSGSGLHLYDANPPFTKIKDVPTSVIGTNGSAGTDARWDYADPNIMYFTPGGFNKYDITTSGPSTLLHDFKVEYPPTHGVCYDDHSVACSSNTECAEVPGGHVCVFVPACYATMQEEGTSSDDSRYWAFDIKCWDYPSPTGSNPYSQAIVVYDKDYYGKDSGKIISTINRLDLLFPPSNTVGYTSVSPDGNWVMAGDTYWGHVVYNRALTQNLHGINDPRGTSHADWALDENGAVVYVSADKVCDGNTNVGCETDSNCAGGTGPCTYWVTMRNIQTCWAARSPAAGRQVLAPMGGAALPSGYYHISGLGHDKPGWVIVSQWSPDYPNVESAWGHHSVYMVELTYRAPVPTLTNHANVWRLAHTHTKRPGGSYLDNPFAKINRSGTKVFFGSGWDTSAVDGISPAAPTWVTGTLYTVNTIVKNGSSYYVCLFLHTSGVFTTDLASGFWNPVQYDTYQINLPTTWYQDLMGFNILTSSLAAIRVGSNYSQTLQVSGGTAPYTWSITSGFLPSGLLLNPSTGVISGTATTQGTFNFTIQVSDSSSPVKTVTKALTTVIPAPPKELKIVPSS